MDIVDPHVPRKMSGRHRKLRLRENGEDTGTRLSRRGKRMKCQNCFHQGHNSRSCTNTVNINKLVS
ncbi:hypothetical protein REPUB_Repub16aG0006900 [Reevesia pubescens]